jgi:death-on-curing protein
VEYLTLEEVYLLHERLIQLTGGSSGLRDPGLLESAVARPQASFDGEDLYPDLWTKAAALMQSLIKNHPFVDGNKRTAVTATAVFLELNHHRLTANNDEVLRFAVQMAGGQAELEEIAAWLEAHSSPA